MKKVFVDTNLFMRYLVNDIPEQVGRVENLLDLAEKGEITLVTGPPVFFEMAWTLKSFYNLSRIKIYECLSSILGIPGLEVIDIDILEDALELYKASSADFSDTYIAVLAGKVEANAIATFNKKHFKDFAVKIYPLN